MSSFALPENPVDLRSRGIGGSDIAALVGFDPRRDAFAVYAEKLGLVERPAPTARMIWGRRIEKVIAEAYAEETGRMVAWIDFTVQPMECRPWQVATPDALVYSRNGLGGIAAPGGASGCDGGLDAKNVSLDQASHWGEPGTAQVPDWIGCQCQWYCSAFNLPWWDVAALFGGNDLRIYRVEFDRDVEAILLGAAERFWREHIEKQNPPVIGASETANRYLRQRFPENTERLRLATDEEVPLLSELRAAKIAAYEVGIRESAAENAVKQAIAESDGLLCGAWKVTWKKAKDTLGPDWEKMARDLGATAEMITGTQTVVRQGTRRLHCNWGKTCATGKSEEVRLK